MADMKEAQTPFHDQHLEVDGTTKIVGGKGTGGRAILLDKTKLIILVAVILLLLITIVILAAILGHERASKKPEIKQPGGKEDDANSNLGGPTTAGPEPWWKIRLPHEVKPYHYDLILYVDLKRPHFNGAAKIWVDISSPTPYILLHAVNMNFTTVAVQNVLGEILPIKRHFEFDKNQFRVIEMGSPLQTGRFVVILEFSAKYADDMKGMYKASFQYLNGTESFYSATQFDPLHARKAFPCFDEPAMKATFNMTLVHDPRLIALSNMPIYHSEKRDGWAFDHFEKTFNMSTFLTAFTVGNFKYKEVITKTRVKMRIYARGDVIDLVDYSLFLFNKTMTYFEEFFGFPFPLPKSDGIALPVFRPSAMESWGLIKYQEASLLLKDGERQSAAKENIAKRVVLQIAHQWFGNMVTMKWWTDVWLNKGFATYFSVLGMDHAHPDWSIIDQFIARAVQKSLERDGFSNSRALRIPVNDPNKISEIFDAIPYKKGASILLMLRFFLGTKSFQEGVKRYLTEHAYGNVETNDLWDAMTEASRSDGGQGITVSQMMNTWSEQMGYPVITVEASSTPNMYSATQKRFLYYKDPNTTENNSSLFGYKWVIPFTYYTGTKKTSNPPSSTFSKIIDKTSVDIPWDGSGWIKGNIGQTGFYRVNYDEKNWDLLAEQLRHDYKVFNATDRAGLIDDSFNLARANLLNYTKALDITTYLPNEVDYVPWLSAIRKFSWIMEILPPSRPACKYLKKYLAHITKAQYNKLGVKDEGTHLEKFQRTALLNANCEAGVTSCLNNMTQLYRSWMQDPVKNAISPDLKALVYHFGIRTGGAEEWDFAYRQFKSTKVVSDKTVLLYGMAGAQESWIIERYLGYLLNPLEIGPRYAETAVYYIAHSNPLGASLVWNFLQQKWEEIISKMSGGAYSALRFYVPQGTRRFSTEFHLHQVQDFLKKKLEGEALPWSVKQAIEKIKANIQWRKTHEQDILSWLKEFFAKLGDSAGSIEEIDFSDPA